MTIVIQIVSQKNFFHNLKYYSKVNNYSFVSDKVTNK